LVKIVAKLKHIRGNLRNTNGIIVKTRMWDRGGHLLHKGSFSMDDEKSVKRELITWRDGLGVSDKIFKAVLRFKGDDEVRRMLKDRLERDKRVIKEALAGE